MTSLRPAIPSLLIVNDFSENWFPLWGIMLRRQSRQSRPTTFLWASTSVRISPKPPMAMLELLARAARTGLIASDFAPGRGISGVSGHGRAHGRAGVTGEGRDRFRHREFILAGCRI